MRLLNMLGGLLLGTLAAMPASADRLVVQVSGPAAKLYPVGTCVPASTRITLAPEDRIVLIDESGMTVWSGEDTAALSKRRAMGATRGMRLRGVDACAAWRSSLEIPAGTALASR